MNPIRDQSFNNKIIFVDGLPGCGKTLVNQLVTGLQRVELLSYSYEIEYACALYFLKQLSFEGAKTFIRLVTDLKVYNTMMARDLNFRPSDLSSIFSYHSKNIYLKRILDKGDETIPQKIINEKPILNVAVHNLLLFAEPIFYALGNRCCFIEVLRHPAYMVKQQSLNFKNCNHTKRDFTVYFKSKNKSYPYYVFGWEHVYRDLNAYEKSVFFIVKNRKQTSEKLSGKFKQTLVLRFPFEKIVKNPLHYLKIIANHCNTDKSQKLKNVMQKENVPRKMVADGINLPIYERCGWVPPNQNTEKKELNKRKSEIAKKLRPLYKNMFLENCEEYEQNVWNPEWNPEKSDFKK